MILKQMTGKPIEVSRDEARRIAVCAQLLDGSASSVIDTVRRLGFLQLDPISTVAPPQHLVLFSRLGATYDRTELDRLLWQERELFEWNAFLWPRESLPIIRARMRRRTSTAAYGLQRVAEFLRANEELPAVRVAGACVSAARSCHATCLPTWCGSGGLRRATKRGGVRAT